MADVPDFTIQFIRSRIAHWLRNLAPDGDDLSDLDADIEEIVECITDAAVTEAVARAASPGKEGA